MSDVVQLLGMAILGLAFVQVAGTAYGAVRRRYVQSRQATLALELFEERARLELEATRIERERRSLGWEGMRKFRLSRRQLEADDVCSFYLEPHDGEPIPPFNPGQYLTLQLKIPGQAKPVVRCYSLSDSPLHRDYYRITVKRLPPPPSKADAPPGLVSSHLHGMEIGSLIDIRAPSGNFFLDRSSGRPVVLIGGGVGLTPVLSMLNTICESGSRRETWFFYGVRFRREHAMYEHLKRIAAEHDNVHLVVCYSNPTETCARGTDFDVEGWVSVDLLREKLPSNNYEFYICGPPPMMEAVSSGLRDWGVPESDIHFEAFGPATVKRQAAPDAPSGAPTETIPIEFTRSGKSVTWKEGDGSILDVALAAGVPLDFGCRAGNCGTCETAIRSGAVRYLIEPGAKPKDGSCLPCIGVPKAALALDA